MGIVSHRTAASLLSERGFIHRTIKPRLDNSGQARVFMKFDARCITSIPTRGVGCGASGVNNAPFTALGTPGKRMYLGLLCPNAVAAAVGMSQAKAMADIRRVIFI
jgi:hypothetical protein